MLSAKVDDANIVLIDAVVNIVAGCGFDHWLNPLTCEYNTGFEYLCSFTVPLEHVAHILINLPCTSYCIESPPIYMLHLLS